MGQGNVSTGNQPGQGARSGRQGSIRRSGESPEGTAGRTPICQLQTSGCQWQRAPSPMASRSTVVEFMSKLQPHGLSFVSGDVQWHTVQFVVQNRMPFSKNEKAGAVQGSDGRMMAFRLGKSPYKTAKAEYQRSRHRGQLKCCVHPRRSP